MLLQRGTTDPAAPVFLVGPARSGTSLLYKLLCLHPEVAYLSNYVRSVPTLPQLGVLNRLARRLPDLERRRWFGSDSNAYVYGGPRAAMHRAFPAPVEGEPVYAACGVTQLAHEVPAPRDEQIARLRAVFTQVQRASGGSVLVNKRIANNRRIPLLAEAFPDARFIRLVRDGRAVALSLSTVDWWLDDEVWWAGTTPRAWAASGRDPWEICARNWVEEVRATQDGLRDVPADRVFALRYEDFVASPGQTLEQLARFCGLTQSPRWRQQLDRLAFPDRNDRWREALDGPAVAVIESFQKQTLAAHGYVV